MNWKENTARVGPTSYTLMVGRFNVATIRWAMTGRNDPSAYDATVVVCGRKAEKSDPDLESLKRWCEQAAGKMLRNLNDALNAPGNHSFPKAEPPKISLPRQPTICPKCGAECLEDDHGRGHMSYTCPKRGCGWEGFST